ncbi:hypothetical protein LCGC14_1302370, partial [marine sediment metagenome]
MGHLSGAFEELDHVRPLWWVKAKNRAKVAA